MIHKYLNHAGVPMFSCDRWHVIHSRWRGDLTSAPSFSRSVHSEHPSRETALAVARELIDQIVARVAVRPLAMRDQVFVRKPGYRSFVTALRVPRKRGSPPPSKA